MKEAWQALERIHANPVFIQEVRGNTEYDAIKIMMVTTETEQERVVQALEAGANEYIMKPFTSEVIQEKLLLLGLGN